MERKENYQLLKKKLQSELLEALETGGEWSDEEIMGQIDELIVSASRNVYLSGYKKLMMKQELFNSVRRLDLLQELVDDKDITEIMVNGAGDIFYENTGICAGGTRPLNPMKSWKTSFSRLWPELIGRSMSISDRGCPVCGWFEGKCGLKPVP